MTNEHIFRTINYENEPYIRKNIISLFLEENISAQSNTEMKRLKVEKYVTLFPCFGGRGSEMITLL